MDPASGKVLLIDAKNQLTRAIEGDLAGAGFEVVSIGDPRMLLETARGRAVAALILPPGGVTRGVWRRWNSEPDLRDVPVVLFASRRPWRHPLPWPLAPFVRAGAYISATDLKRSGAASDVVRASITRVAGVTPTGPQRFGEALWHVGSVLYVVGLLLGFVAGVALAMMRLPYTIVVSALSLGTGKLLMDLGASVGLGQRPRLQWGSWVFLALVLGGIVVFLKR